MGSGGWHVSLLRPATQQEPAVKFHNRLPAQLSRQASISCRCMATSSAKSNCQRQRAVKWGQAAMRGQREAEQAG